MAGFRVFSTTLLFAFMVVTTKTFAQLPSRLITEGGKADDHCWSLCTDTLGNSYSTGSFRDTLWMGSAFVVSKGGSDVFLAKHDASGNLVWLRTGGGAGNDMGAWITQYKNNFLYVSGTFNQIAYFSGKNITASSNSNDDGFIAKYDMDGNLVWLKGGGSASFADRVGKIAFSNTNMFVAVSLGPSATFCGTGSLSSNGGLECYVMKMDTAANVAAYAYFGGTSNDYVNEVRVDQNQNIIATGNFSSATLKVGTSNYSNLGNYDFFYIKMDHSLNFLWTVTGGGTGGDEPEETQLDAAGNIYSTGHITVALKIGSTTYYNCVNNGLDGYVMKLSPAGNVLWVKGIGSAQTHDSRGLILDKKGMIHVVGNFKGSLAFGTTIINAIGSGYDLFMCGLDTTNGGLAYMNRYGGKGDELCNNIAIDPYGILHIGGFHSDTTTFGNFSSPTKGSYDITNWRFSLLKITTANEVPSIICRTGSAFTYPLTFTQENSYPGISGYRALLSDSTGNFSSALIIGTASLNNNVVNITIPTSVPDGGGYRLRVEALAAVGNWAGSSTDIRLASKPVSAFNVTNPVQCFNGHSMVFNNTSTIANGTFSSLWKYGDNTTSASFSETRSYTTSGTFNVRLVITSAYGCRDSVNHNVKVYPTPEASLNTTATSVCQGDSVMLKATNMTVYHHQWFFNGLPISGDTLKLPGDSAYKHYAKTSGTYQVMTTNDYGCDSLSAAVSITMKPLPAKPVITRNADTLYASPAPSYQWYKDNALLTGETNNNYHFTSFGDYTVRVDSNGCSNISDPYILSSTGTKTILPAIYIHIYPNPSSGKVKIETSATLQQITLTNMLGETVYTTNEPNKISWELSLTKGVYIVHVSTSEGMISKKLVIQ